MRGIRVFGLAVLLAGGVSIFGGSASALPATTFGQGALSGLAADSTVTQVHGCHRNWRRGSYSWRGRQGWGWHRHVGRNCRVEVARQYRDRDRPRDWQRRGCFTVGPVTICPPR